MEKDGDCGSKWCESSSEPSFTTLDYKCEEHWILTVSLTVCVSNSTRATVEGVHFHVFTDSLIHLVSLITSLTFESNLTHVIIRLDISKNKHTQYIKIKTTEMTSSRLKYIFSRLY